MYNVLFLCTGNSARSIIAEALLNHLGGERFRGFSAGSNSANGVHPLALRVLEENHISTQGLHSKAWLKFAAVDSVPLHFVFTLCDLMRGEGCRLWPGSPRSAHWGVPDPAAAVGDDADKRLAFDRAFRSIENRIKAFASLPIDTLDELSLQARLDALDSCD